MVKKIMESRSSAQMVARGQIQEFSPMHPLENGVSATDSEDVRAPIGYGAQRVTMLANILASEMAKTPCHHSVLGHKLTSAFSASSLRKKS